MASTTLFGLALALVALLTGAAASAVAFLLYRQKGDPTFRDFGTLVVALGVLGAFDLALGLGSGTKVSADQAGWLVAGGAGAVAAACLVAGLSLRFLVKIAGLVPGRMVQMVAWAPALAALVGAVAWGLGAPVLPAEFGDGQAHHGVVQAFLAAMLLWITAGVGVVIVRWNRIHDRLWRRIARTCAVVLGLFLPIWATELAGWTTLAPLTWFYLLWNLGALGVAAQTWFTKDPGPTHDLVSPQMVEALALRFGLTPREAELLPLHLEGRTAAEIGATLFISPKTVRNHISNLYQKTGTHGRFPLLALVRSTSPRA